MNLINCKPYTVVLQYPNSRETYIETNCAATPASAAWQIQLLASDANGNDIAPEDFDVLVVFEGDLHPVL